MAGPRLVMLDTVYVSWRNCLDAGSVVSLNAQLRLSSLEVRLVARSLTVALRGMVFPLVTFCGSGWMIVVLSCSSMSTVADVWLWMASIRRVSFVAVLMVNVVGPTSNEVLSGTSN